MSQRRDPRDAPCTEFARDEIERRMAAVRRDAEIARLDPGGPGWAELVDRVRAMSRRLRLRTLSRR